MITKGIIKSIDFNGNSCIVRMPYFETAGSSEVVCEALVSNTPGVYNGYKENDVVWVAFEDGHMESPVVLGKLYLGASKEKQDPRGTINCVDSTISGTATIPNDTKLKNDLDYGQINTTIPYYSLSSLANNLQRVDIEQGQNNRDLGNKLRTVVDGIGPDGSKLYSLIEQTDARLTNEVGRKLDTDSGTKEQAFGWDLTADSWKVFARGSVALGAEGTTKVVSVIEKINDHNVQKTYVIINGVNSLELTEANKTTLGIINDNYSVIESKCVQGTPNNVWEIYNSTDSSKKITTDVPAETKEVLTATTDGLKVNGNGTFTGDITASTGYIGKFVIGEEHSGDSGIYSTNYIDSFDDTPRPGATGVYVGTDGIKLGTNFSVDTSGNVIAKTLKTIISTETRYAIGASGTSHSDIQEADWKLTIDPTTNAKPFLWSRTKTIYTTGDPEYTYTVSSSVSVVSTIVAYQNSTDGTQPPSGGTWTSTASPEQGKFTWARTTVTYSDSHTSVSYSVSYTGNNGTSIEIDTTAIKYKNSTDGTTHPTDPWENWSNRPNPEKGKYLWSWTKIKYTDTSISDTDLYNVSYMGSDADISEVNDTYILGQLGIPTEGIDPIGNAGLYYGVRPGTSERTLYVNADYLTAKKLKVTNSSGTLLDAGATSSTSVTIGGFTVGTKALTAGTSGTTNYVKLGTEEIALGKDFKVTKAGELTANAGKIGNLEITSTGLSYWNPEAPGLAFNIGEPGTDTRLPSYAISAGRMRIDNAFFGFKGDGYSGQYWSQLDYNGLSIYYTDGVDPASCQSNISLYEMKYIPTVLNIIPSGTGKHIKIWYGRMTSLGEDKWRSIDLSGYFTTISYAYATCQGKSSSEGLGGTIGMCMTYIDVTTKKVYVANDGKDTRDVDYMVVGY